MCARSILMVYRIENPPFNAHCLSLFSARSTDEAEHWSESTPLNAVGSSGFVWGVWPQLLRLDNGVLALSGGR